MSNFFKDKAALTTPVLSNPTFLGAGKFKLRLKEIKYVEETSRNREEGVAMTWTVVESDNLEFKTEVDYVVLFFIRHFGLENYRKFCKEAILPLDESFTEENLSDPAFLAHWFEGEGKNQIEGMYCDVIGTPKLSKEKKVPIVTFRYGALSAE